MSEQLLVPLDGSPLADAAVPVAVDIARRLGLDIVLTRVHSPATIMPYPPEMPILMMQPEWDGVLRKDTRTWLLRHAADLARTSGLQVSAAFRVGNAAEEIVAVATRRSARAIVCSTHGAGGLAPHWLGSVADRLVRNAPCPVIALPPDAPARSDEMRILLVLLDGSDHANRILPEAAWFADGFHSDVELLTVVSPDWMDSADAGLPVRTEDPLGIDAYAVSTKVWLDEVAAGLRAAGLRVRTTVEVGSHAARTILDHIARTNPDAIALATHGRGLSRLILGSVADKVLRASGRPALVVGASAEVRRHRTHRREFDDVAELRAEESYA
jgi:nucleotide-binding universal stress UspA family protein